MSLFNTAITLGLVLGFSLMMLGLAGALVLIVQIQKLVRQIRKLAQLYPPYYGVSEEEDGRDRSNVVIEKQWDESLDGRD
jgi:hypothetical protein